jgi:hypothetical protein
MNFSSPRSFLMMRGQTVLTLWIHGAMEKIIAGWLTTAKLLVTKMWLYIT